MCVGGSHSGAFMQLQIALQVDVAVAPANMSRVGCVNSIVTFYCEERIDVYPKFGEFSVNIDLLMKRTHLVLEVLSRTESHITVLNASESLSLVSFKSEYTHRYSDLKGEKKKIIVHRSHLWHFDPSRKYINEGSSLMDEVLPK